MKTIIAVILLCAGAGAPWLAAQNTSTARDGTEGTQAFRSSALLRAAAQREPMSLSDVERLALANNPTLAQAVDLVRASAGEARQAGLYPNPSAGYEGSEIRGGSFGGGEQGAFVSQTIVLGGKLGLRKRVFKEQQQEDEAGVAVQKERLLGDVDQRFYAALSAQEAVKLRQQLFKIAEDAVETAHQLANVGQAGVPDILQAQVEAGQAKIGEETAERNYIAAFAALATTVGKPGLPLAPLAGSLTPWPQIHPRRLMANLVRNSPSIKRAEDAVARAQAEVRSARREAIPDLHLRAGIQQDQEPIELSARPRTPAGLIGFASVGIDLPVFNRNQGNVAAAEADLDRARAEVTREKLSLERTAEPIVQDVLAEQSEASEYHDSMIPNAERAYKIYLDEYREMASAYPAVLISQRTLFQVKLAYLKTLTGLWHNAIALQHFTLTNALAAPEAAGTASSTVNLPDSGGMPK